jgi:gliding motility-associated-like protein
MKNKFTKSLLSKLFATTLILLVAFKINAQTTNNQTVVQKCYNGPTVSNGNTFGTLLPGVSFLSGVDIPAGHKVVDVIVEIVWSKTDDGSCTPATGTPPNLTEIGFQIKDPLAGPQYLAVSSAVAGVLPGALLPTFTDLTGTNPNIISDVTVFTDAVNSTFPLDPSDPANDTISSNGTAAVLESYVGQDPYGLWQVGLVDDAPLAGPALCIESYCITLVTCDFDTLVASCKANPTVALDPVTGLHALNFSDLDSISDVSCILKDVTFSTPNVSCADIGVPVLVTMILQDKLDSTASCQALVTVVDTTAPNIPDCSLFPTPFTTIYLDANGVDTILASQINMSDACGPITKELRSFASPTYGSSVGFNCSNAASPQQIYVRGTDGSGNQNECILVVSVLDTFPPVAVCGSDTVFVGNGPASISGINLDAGSFDVCPPIIGRWIGTQFAPNPFYSCVDLGIDTVVLVVSDFSSNIASCDSAIVFVVDTVSPTALCQNFGLNLDASGNATLLPTNIDAGSSDICGVDSFNVNGVSSVLFDCSHLNAPQTVTLNVFDASGNTASCTADVTVLDVTPPTAICQNFTIYLDASGDATLVASSLNNNSTDLCTGNFLDFQVSGSNTVQLSCNDVGVSVQTLSVLDSFGNTATCPSNLTVLDTVSPIANCLNPTVYLNASGNVNVFAADISGGSTDNCAVIDSSINVLGNNSAAFVCAAIFTPQVVTLLVEDTEGNIGTCVSSVTVLDTVSPVAICNATYSAALDATGNALVLPTDIDNGSTDNCGLVEYLINGFAAQNYTCADVGSINAVLTVRDSSGQTSSCFSTINVVDNIPPTAACQVTNAYLDAAGIVVITPNDVLAFPATSDNCSTVNTTFLGSLPTISYSCDSVGVRIVDLVVVDASGNSASCQTTVSVLDTINPTASCSPVPYTVQLDGSGQGFVVPLDVDNGSFDICGIDTMLVNSVDTFFYSCADVGNTAVTLSVLDASGNLGTCVANIVVNDPINPTAICKDTTVYLDASGIATVFAAQINNGSFDNCPSLSYTINGLPSFNYNCSSVGVNTASLAVTDAGGNASLCPANITVIDTITPVASCVTPATLNVYLDNACFASVPATTFNDGSSDNCGASLVYSVAGLPNATFSSASLLSNPNTVTLTVCDGSANCNTCTTTVIVQDTSSPVVICKIDTVQLDALGNAIVLASNINDGSTDNCSSPSLSINGGLSTTVTCANLGSNSVTLTATDPSGNSSSCLTTVIVEDLTAPNASCNASVTVILDASSNGTLTPAEVDLGSSDNCTLATLTLSKTSFNCGDIPGNPHTITMLATDQSGNLDSCTAQVSVLDTVDPVALCIPGTLNLSLVGSTVSTTVAAVNNGSTDNCAIQSISLSQTTFDCNDIGINNLTMTVQDSSGNTGTCFATVDVVDNTNPVAFCNSPTVTLDASGTVQVAATDLALPGSLDNCSLSTILADGVDTVTFTCANLGVNLLNVFIQDPSSNSATCQSTVTVVDGVNPVANCVATPIDLFLDAAGVATLNPVDLDAGSSDNCAIVSFTISQDTFRCSDIPSSPNTVILTVTDVSGNTDNCTASVTVNDTIRPAMACQPSTVIVQLSAGGLATITADSFDNGTSDACGLASLIYTGAPNPVTCADLGISPITLIATDINGNTDSCVTSLTVLDTVPPTLVCNNISLNLDALGAVVVDASTTGLYTMSDACGTPTLTLDGGTAVSYDCTNLGPNNITLVATDGSANATSCVTVITISDITAPVVSCASSIQVLDALGALPIDPLWLNASVVEACGIDTIYTSPDTFDCSNVGPFNTVTLFVVDESGNVGSCTGNIEVLDTTAPTMLCNDTTICLTGGFVSVAATDIDGGSFDACGLSPVLSINGSNNVIYTCADIGPQAAILQRQDVNGNLNTCTATVTVQDCTPPTAVCQPSNYTVQVSTAGFVVVQATALDFGSFDDCGIDPNGFKANGLDSLIYSCANVGIPDTVVLTVSDVFGNTANCTTVVEVIDVENPVARCGGPVNAVLSASGTVTIAAFNINATLPATPSSDNCGIDSYLINGQANYVYDCTALGANSAVLTITDLSGNSDTCQAIVNILDNTPPTASCLFAASITLDQAGVAILPADTLILSSSDNCGIDSILANGQQLLTFGCSDIGNNVVNVTVIDSSGNQFSCNSIVNVSDNTSPVAICPTVPVQAFLNGTSFAYVSANEIDSASFDNCGIEFYQINGTDSILYNCSQIGQFPTATLTVIDSFGNSDVCTATIEVLDTIPPVAICNSFTVTLGLDGTANVLPNAIDNGSFDNCGITSYLINGNTVETFNCTNVNTVNLVVLTVIDNYGNQSFCTETVTVVDATAPQVQCSGAPVDFYLNASGVVTVDPQQLATASDSCSVVSWFINGLPDSTFDCSQTNITHFVEIRVEDPSGNFATCNSFLNVIDSTPPASNACQSNITIALDSFGVNTLTGADISFFPTDNCSIVDTLINGQTSITYTCDSAALQQPLTAVLTLTDPSGNQSTCVTSVNLVDNIAPVALCNDTLFNVQLDNQGTVTVFPSTIDNGSYDACSPLTYLINSQPSQTFDCTNIATSVNGTILTVTDANGNSSTCLSYLEIVDNLPPTVICNDTTIFISGSSVTLNAIGIDGGSFDNCFIGSYAFSNGATTRTFSCSDTGQISVSLVVTDIYGNVDSCFATVTIRDTTPPSVSCNQITVDLTDTLQAVLVYNTPFSALNVGSASDNCSFVTVDITPSIITCTDVGNVPFTLTATDASGNVAFCEDTVVVFLDRPTILTPTQDTVLCEGEDINFTSSIPSNGINYDLYWLNPGSDTLSTTTAAADSNLTFADEGFYTFVIEPQNGTGCPSLDSIYVDINEVQPPVLTALQPCDGDSTVINLANANTYIGSSITYIWYFNGNQVPGNNIDSLLLADMSVLDSGTYSMAITVTEGPATCYDSSAVGLVLDVLDLPAAPIPTANIPCDGDSLTLLNNAPGFSYVWDGPLGFVSSDATPVLTNITLAQAGTYNLTITDANNCSNAASVAVTVLPTPQQPSLLYTQPLCFGDLLELTDSATYSSGPLAFYWENPSGLVDTTAIPQLLVADAATGTYMLTVSMNGCLSETGDTASVDYEPFPSGADDSYTIVFRDSLVAADIVLNDNPTTNGYIVVLIDSVDGGTVQNNGDGTITYRPRSGFFGLDTLTYALCDALCTNNCDTMRVYIEVTSDFECFVPNGISPNGDGVNDFMNISCKNSYPDAVLQVFSRWGTQVYEGSMTGFNGTFNGNDLPDGTYFYFLKLNDATNTPGTEPGRNGDEYTGFIMLQR